MKSRCTDSQPPTSSCLDDPDYRKKAFAFVETTVRRYASRDNLLARMVLEDPFPRFHLEDFKALRCKIAASVVVHIDPPESLRSVIASGTAGGLNLDSAAVGPFQWRVLAGAAEQANLSVWHGGGCDLGIGTAWHLQLATSAPNCRLPGDQSGPWLREHTLIKQPFQIVDGCIVVPPGPGIGVDVDMAAVESYTLISKAWIN